MNETLKNFIIALFNAGIGKNDLLWDSSEFRAVNIGHPGTRMVSAIVPIRGIDEGAKKALVAALLATGLFNVDQIFTIAGIARTHIRPLPDRFRISTEALLNGRWTCNNSVAMFYEAVERFSTGKSSWI